jgi:putative ATPase
MVRRIPSAKCHQLLNYSGTSPICSKEVSALNINEHIDSSCTKCVGSPSQQPSGSATTCIRQKNTGPSATTVAPIFKSNTIQGPRGTDAASHSQEPFATKRPAETADNMQPTKATKRIRTNLDSAAPLAERLRPTELSEFVGQSHLTGPGSVFMNMLASGSAVSMILWGPPG